MDTEDKENLKKKIVPEDKEKYRSKEYWDYRYSQY